MKKYVAKVTAYIAAILCLILALGFSGIESGAAASKEESFIADFSQTVYNSDSGLGSNEINDVYQTESGYIWIGTDAGLYRYNGSEFRVYNLWDTDRDDIYVVSSLFQDSKGRLWVCTENYGLFYIQGSTIYHFDEEYYSGVKNVTSVCELSDGRVAVGTAYGLYEVSDDSESLIRNEDLTGIGIRDLDFFNDKLWGITRSGKLFSISSEGTYKEENISKYSSASPTSLESDESFLYIGTSGRDLIRISKSGSGIDMSAGREYINDICITEDRIFICTDSGAGYFDTGRNYHSVTGTAVDDYLSCMMVDYEGNYWFGSSRMGLLSLKLSKFSDYNARYSVPSEITNCIISFKNNYYIGTDNGLIINDPSGSIISNELTERLSQARISDMDTYKNDILWISMSRNYGVLRYDGSKFSEISKSDGLLSNQVNAIEVMSDGKVAVATDSGISFIDEEGNVITGAEITEEDGLNDTNIISIFEASDNTLYAGTESDGLYSVKNGTVHRFTEEEGMTSEDVLSIVEDKGKIFIGTGNGLFVLDGSIRQVSSIDYSNDIYDMIPRDGYIWIIGSKGVLRTTQEEMLGPDGVQTRPWSSADGLFKTININSDSYMDDDGILYICCNEGIMTLDTENIRMNETVPKFAVSEIDVDGTRYLFDQIGGTLELPKDVSRVTITLSLLTFTNHENSSIEYQLSGVDKEPVTVSGSQMTQIVYTNLDGGTYIFSINAENADGVRSRMPLIFTMNKQLRLTENIYFTVLLTIGIALLLLIGLMVVIRARRQVAGKQEELLKTEKEMKDIEHSSNVRTDYIASLSSEIKVPINSIIMLAEDMKKRPVNEDEKKNIESIIISGNDIIEKVDETIMLTQLESGKAVAEKEPYSLTTLLCDVSDYAVNSLTDTQVRFFIDLGENMPDILIGDYAKIKTVLTILIDNAVKHTKEGSVTLSVESFDYADEDHEDMVNINFTLTDTGVGLTEAQVESLFTIQSSESGTSGISLTVASLLAKLLDGEIVAESTFGAGTAVTFSLLEKKEDSKIYSSDDFDLVTMMSKEEAEKLIAPDVNALVVDDVDVNRTVSASVLNNFEIRTDVAGSGVTALDMIMNSSYDIIFMDAIMPVMSGIDTLKEIRDLSDPRTRSIPIIAMSEDATGSDKEELLRAGFDDVVLKPIDIRFVAGILRRHLGEDMVKERPEIVEKYITESRYWDGLLEMSDEIDAVAGLEKVGGSVDVYNKLLTAFYNQNTVQISQLEEAFGKSLRDFRNRIHNIKNNAVNIGAEGLAQDASTLESAINIGNRTYVKNNLNAFIRYLKKVVDEVGVYLDYVDRIRGLSDEEFDNMIKAESESQQQADEGGDAPLNGALPVGAAGQDVAKDLSQENEAEPEQKAPDQKIPDQKEAGEEGPDSDGEDADGGSRGRNMRKRIDKKYLTAINNAFSRKKVSRAKAALNDIRRFSYGAEDNEFIDALSDLIESGDGEAVRELIKTYIDLKY